MERKILNKKKKLSKQALAIFKILGHFLNALTYFQLESILLNAFNNFEYMELYLKSWTILIVQIFF